MSNVFSSVQNIGSKLIDNIVFKPSAKLDPTGYVDKIQTNFGVGGGKKEGSNDPESPTPMPESPKSDDSAAKAQELARKKKANQSQSIYSNPLGLSGEASVVRTGLKDKLGQ